MRSVKIRIFPIALSEKHTKRSTPNVYVLYSLSTHNTSMVLPVEPEFEQVLLYSIYPLHVTLTLPSPPPFPTGS